MSASDERRNGMTDRIGGVGLADFMDTCLQPMQ